MKATFIWQMRTKNHIEQRNEELEIIIQRTTDPDPAETRLELPSRATTKSWKEISRRTLCLNSTGLWVLSQIHHAFPWLSDFLHAIPSTDCPCSERKSGTGPSLLVPRRNQPWSWTCSLQNCRKEVSAVWKESMVLCYGSWSKRAHQSSEGAWLKRKITEEYGGEKWKKTEPCR